MVGGQAVLDSQPKPLLFVLWWTGRAGQPARSPIIYDARSWIIIITIIIILYNINNNVIINNTSINNKIIVLWWSGRAG